MIDPMSFKEKGINMHKGYLILLKETIYQEIIITMYFIPHKRAFKIHKAKLAEFDTFVAIMGDVNTAA